MTMDGKRVAYMELEYFHLERFQSTWEHVVKYNLAESGVLPITLEELLGDGGKVNELMQLPLGYIQTNGSSALRGNIASLHKDAGEGNVLVTSGSSEANLLAVWSLMEMGDEALVMLPNYMQIWGLVKMMGGNAIPLWLNEGDGWSLDLGEVNEKVTRKTKIIALCNPNNPTGSVLDQRALRGVREIAEDVGSWIICDEVYRGAELEGYTTPSIWDGHDKVIVNSGLSKAYGLPGLRIGWIVAKEDVINKLWSYHDYTTICTSATSDFIANLALGEGNRKRLMSRTRRILTENWPILERWYEDHSNAFSYVKPKAGAISFAKYRANVNSTAIAERLVKEKSVLVIPGDHFLLDGHMRIGYGSNARHLEMSLALVADLFETL